MLSISIEKQRKRWPFFKFSLADGWAGSRRAEGPDLSNGNIFYDCSFLLFQMLSNSIEKQRKRPPFFKSGLGKEMLTILEILFGGRRTEICFRIVYFYCLKCFRIILKSIGNAGLFSNFVICLMCPCGRTWRHSRVGGRV
jgi:hypothetical protein